MPPVLKAIRATLAQLVPRGIRAIREQLALKAIPVCKATPARLVQRGHRATRG